STSSLAISCVTLRQRISPSLSFFFFNPPATTELYTLSLHDALPIYGEGQLQAQHHLAEHEELRRAALAIEAGDEGRRHDGDAARSEEHTSELQSLTNLVCRLLLEKKKTNSHRTPQTLARQQPRSTMH